MQIFFKEYYIEGAYFYAQVCKDVRSRDFVTLVNMVTGGVAYIFVLNTHEEWVFSQIYTTD